MTAILGGLLVGIGILVAVLGNERTKRRRVENLRQILDLQSLSPAAPDDAEQTSSLLARSGLLAERALADAIVMKATRVSTIEPWPNLVQ